MHSEKEYIKKAAALEYDKDRDNAPKVTAKGKGDIAKKIIQIAQTNQLPIKKDEDLVEMLSQIELDKEIPTQLYKAVAEIFSFIHSITKKKPS